MNIDEDAMAKRKEQIKADITIPAALKTYQEPIIQKSPFVFIGKYEEYDGYITTVDAWDIPHCGCVVRTWLQRDDGPRVIVSEVFVPDAGIRGGKVVRSMI